MSFALILNKEGLITSIIKDTSSHFTIGTSIINSIDSFSKTKFLALLNRLISQKAEHDVEINFKWNEIIKGYRINAIHLEQNILLSGTSKKSKEIEIIEEFSEINSEQNQFLRNQIKQVQKIHQTHEENFAVENIQLKKEISFIKKELVKKNHEIQKSENQIKTIKNEFFELIDEIKSSLILIQTDYLQHSFNNENQILEIKEMLSQSETMVNEI
jgi:hypothetical protein